jgi:hypothetical protein
MENGCLALKQKERVSFLRFWHIKDDFAQLNTINTIFKAEKAQSPMIYPMVQSVVQFCLEIDKKRLLQWHCPWSSSSKNKIFKF